MPCCEDCSAPHAAGSGAQCVLPARSDQVACRTPLKACLQSPILNMGQTAYPT